MAKVTVNDLNVNYEIKGSGKPLLMLIGLSFSLLDWGQKFTDRLAQKYQLILFDNRDAGRTSQSSHLYSIADMADDAAGLIAALGIPQVNVFGVSMGGAIAQQFALRYPQQIDKLILGCTMAGGTSSQIGDISGVMNGNLLDLLFTPDFIKVHREELENFLSQTTPFHSQGEALQRQIQAFMTYDTCDTLTDIQAKTLVISGDNDVAIPAANSHFLAANIPGSILEIIADAGHGFCYSHPEIAADLIDRFLQ